MQHELLEKRNVKTIPHLKQYAPVWLVDEKTIAEEMVVQFNVIFRHNRYGWVNRRYRYDGFNDVLYYKGQTTMEETEIARIETNKPFISATVSDVVNAYGG